MTMIPTQQAFNHIVAFEVSKDILVVHTLPADEQCTIPNELQAVRRLLKAQLKRNRKESLGPALIVCEATGGYERHVLDTSEFIRRFLIHVLPKGFHRIRHYGLLAGGTKAKRLAMARKLLGIAVDTNADAHHTTDDQTDDAPNSPCPCCGGTMRIIETFKRGESPRHRPSPSPIVIRIDTS